MWKITNTSNIGIMSVHDSKGIGHTLLPHESVEIDKEPLKESSSMVIEEIEEKKSVEKKSIKPLKKK